MRLISLMYDLVTCLTTTPLRLLSIFGSVIALLGFAFGLLLVVLRLAFGPQWAAEGVYALRRAVHVHRRPVCRYGPARGVYRPHL